MSYPHRLIATMPILGVIPLIIDGQDVLSPPSSRYPANIVRPEVSPGSASTSPLLWIQGANKAQCLAAAESCARAFPAWASTSPNVRRQLFLKLSQVYETIYCIYKLLI